MTVRNWALALVGAALLACLPGCIISVGPGTTRHAYDRCTSADTCSGVTVCQAANTTTSPGATTGGNFCSTSCVTSADCPADSSGFGVVCVSTTSSGQCYRTCGAGNTCPTNFTCGGPAGMTPFCVPDTGSTATCGASGQACCSGSVCNSGLACGTSGGTSNICGIPACGGSGQTCCAGSSCNTGLSCSGGVCSACGNVGSPCCAGNTCTAAGAACGSDGLCGLAPYSGCSGASIGASCLGGVTSSGGVAATTCTVPMIANPGSNGFCTASCDGSAGTGMSMCPTWVGATRSYTYNCYLLQGAVSGNCFIDCPNGEVCPANTTCLMTPVMGGAQVRLCMPMAI